MTYCKIQSNPYITFSCTTVFVSNCAVALQTVGLERGTYLCEPLKVSSCFYCKCIFF